MSTLLERRDGRAVAGEETLGGARGHQAEAKARAACER